MKSLFLFSIFCCLMFYVSTESINPYNDEHLISMFDGKTLEGWTEAKKGEFVVKNGTIHSMGTARGWIYYKTKAGSFRWIFRVRQVSGNHSPTVLIWGTTEPLKDALSAIQFQMPNGGHWDYRPGHNNDGGHLFKEHAHTRLDTNKWAQCEIVANHETGFAKMACCQLATNQNKCKATEVLEFNDKTAGRVGPIAIQIHNKDIHDEYEGSYLETPVLFKPGEFITV